MEQRELLRHNHAHGQFRRQLALQVSHGHAVASLCTVCCGELRRGQHGEGTSNRACPGGASCAAAWQGAAPSPFGSRKCNIATEGRRRQCPTVGSRPPPASRQWL
eukprot:15435509-Alexandrium_andersonii.AAC.1